MQVSLNFPDGSAWTAEIPALPVVGDTIVAASSVYEVTERGWVVEMDGLVGFVFMEEKEGVMTPPSGRYDHFHL